MQKRVVIFIILAATVAVALCSELKGPKGSVCTYFTSRRGSRRVTYRETYLTGVWFWKRTNYRTTWKWQWYTIWDQHEKCCGGYRNASSVCEPICDQGCPLGRCVRPNTCEYNSEYTFGNEDSTYQPFRKNPCTFGTCIAPKTCTCQEGYRWSLTYESCEPVCDSTCEHGWCATPNKCACEAGYALNDKNQCIAICKSGFLYNETTTDCDPVCAEECINGVCTAPDTCECLEGHSKSVNNSSICTMNCENCANGFCDKPNECECHKGFFRDDAGDGECIPGCEFGCIHGRCTALGCVCSFGWEGISCDVPIFCVVVTPTGNNAEDHHESKGDTSARESTEAWTEDTMYLDVSRTTHIPVAYPDDASSSENSVDSAINIRETLSTNANEMTTTDPTTIFTSPGNIGPVIDYTETKWDGPSCEEISFVGISESHAKWIGVNETQEFFDISMNIRSTPEP